MGDTKFRGAEKVDTYMLQSLEKRFIKWATPLVPKGIETYHLTLLTIPFSALIILTGYLANSNEAWLWLTSAAIASQHIADMLDGAVGRYRNTGLVKWGYFMDHFFDYIFLCAILIGYSFLIPPEWYYVLFFTLALFSGFMVSAFLEFGVTGDFRISYYGFGTSEMRLVFIIINGMVAIFGKVFFVGILPVIFLLALVGLAILVYKTQKKIWFIDLERQQKIFRPGRRTIVILIIAIAITLIITTYYALRI
ncbi:hypothetical protein HGA91_03860 [candidate division WWE3 bacterium]|nr:hypothetical protein [candidate division WWE3 bacterium]